MVTPLRSDGVTVHETGVHQLVERLVSQGVHGVFVGGTTGEVWALDDEQWTRLVMFAKDAVRGRVPLYVGVSHASTAGAAARARRAEQLGADVVVSLAPYYIPSGQADIVRHFQALANATALPIIVYQYPGIVKCSITLATYVELAKIPGVVGVKDSLADATEFYHMVQTLRAGGQDFRLFLGTDILGNVAVLDGRTRPRAVARQRRCSVHRGRLRSGRRRRLAAQCGHECAGQRHEGDLQVFLKRWAA